MAQSLKNILLHQVRGQIGKQIVVKRYGNKTVITAYPDMSKVKPSKKQKAKRKLFANAVASTNKYSYQGFFSNIFSSNAFFSFSLFNNAS
jgi:hypothetical protein